LPEIKISFVLLFEINILFIILIPELKNEQQIV